MAAASAVKLTAADINSSRDMLNKIKSDAAVICEKLQVLNDRILTGELSTSNGIAFLDVKNQMLAQYNLDIANLVRLKVNGDPIADNSSIDRLIQMRTFIEKTRPIERKLRYQIEKMLTVAASGGLSENDPLHLKPDPSNMVSRAGDRQDDGKAEEKKDGIYRPPMMSSAHYEAELTKKEREQTLLERARKRAMNTAIMRELAAEYTEAPEEIRDNYNRTRIKQSEEDRAKRAYEESNYTRVKLTKQERDRERRMNSLGDKTLSELTRFGDISSFDKDFVETQRRRKKKTGNLFPHKKKKGKGKKFKK